ncbi:MULTISPECIES: Txe/YoeB family addiction module toxin [Sutterella]|uniref:Txe/YoeB family addiction module toxin n=1 Tax=Sutterella TaxID=40544 RepID=UPI0013F5C7CD|nr:MULTISPECIES: Txe/YoeB family addiction module toxin [Sutterella]MBD8910603.1 Txe/YoeB family addiction module toxin [Sutterella wadsworthensis]MBT9623360.1 Txe/YoeB family addiction module toxin [Sutterella wadsworthensis]MDR3928793.1 Txe/YoeB family addiction module toxin [Sutterella sp.]
MTKVNALIKDIKRNGNSGLGLPEPLTGNLSGFWSRRIDAKNRLIYRISEEDGNRTLEIVQCRTPYNDK